MQLGGGGTGWWGRKAAGREQCLLSSQGKATMTEGISKSIQRAANLTGAVHAGGLEGSAELEQMIGQVSSYKLVCSFCIAFLSCQWFPSSYCMEGWEVGDAAFLGLQGCLLGKQQALHKALGRSLLLGWWTGHIHHKYEQKHRDPSSPLQWVRLHTSHHIGVCARSQVCNEAVSHQPETCSSLPVQGRFPHQL